MFLANNLALFKQTFIQQLHLMLESESLGAFILVLANSMQDDMLYSSLKDPLKQRFSELSKNIHNAPIDDLHVFDKLKTTGIAPFTPWKTYQKDIWELTYNPLRALRPARASQEVINDIHQPFNSDKFHFNKPFLTPEILWEGTWTGSSVDDKKRGQNLDDKRANKNFRILFNKFPFAPWHTLIVPEPEKKQPQYLNQNTHEDIFLLSSQSHHLPGFTIGYNSLGANASINQLHFQGFIRNQPLPIEHPKWQHNGGSIPYPLECHRFEDCHQAWQNIEYLHQQNQPYNLLYRNKHCYVTPRKGQGQTKLPEWAKGIAWHEVCGVFTLANQETVSAISTTDIDCILNDIRVSTH